MIKHIFCWCTTQIQIPQILLCNYFELLVEIDSFIYCFSYREVDREGIVSIVHINFT